MNFTETEVQELSRQIDQRLQELQSQRLAPGSTKSEDSQDKQIPKQESQAIEKAIAEPAESFLKRFGRAAHKDLCIEGGTLHDQWKRYGDLDNKDLIGTFTPLLIDLGVRRDWNYRLE